MFFKKSFPDGEYWYRVKMLRENFYTCECSIYMENCFRRKVSDCEGEPFFSVRVFGKELFYFCESCFDKEFSGMKPWAAAYSLWHYSPYSYSPVFASADIAYDHKAYCSFPDCDVLANFQTDEGQPYVCLKHFAPVLLEWCDRHYRNIRDDNDYENLWKNFLIPYRILQKHWGDLVYKEEKKPSVVHHYMMHRDAAGEDDYLQQSVDAAAKSLLMDPYFRSWADEEYRKKREAWIKAGRPSVLKEES